jgi:hypothetical protein
VEARLATVPAAALSRCHRPRRPAARGPVAAAAGKNILGDEVIGSMPLGDMVDTTSFSKQTLARAAPEYLRQKLVRVGRPFLTTLTATLAVLSAREELVSVVACDLSASRQVGWPSAVAASVRSYVELFRGILSPMRVLLVTAFLLTSACFPPPHVVVTVEDPTGAAADATEVFAGTDATRFKAVRLDRALSFPLQITASGAAGGSQPLLVEARDEAGRAIARGRSMVTLKRRGVPTALVVLARACEQDDGCFDELFCDGTGFCVEKACVYEDAPCTFSFPCVVGTCVEEAKTCHVTVDHSLCPTGSYCDPAAGCVPGPACMPENNGSDCQDASVCNGEEQCVDFHCIPGPSLSLDDGDDCTLDGCNPDDTPQVFHFALPSRDGNPCRQAGGDDGICVASKGGCAESECGDGIVDPSAGELCDDGLLNSDTWTLDQHCNASCSGWGPFCGDNNLSPDHETCDDGARVDSGNGCSDACQRNDGGCGDGIEQSLFEDCDDGANGNNCDGCRDDCTTACVCATSQGCDAAGQWCDDGICSSCDNAVHCGTNCMACAGATPLCGGVTVGCVCDPSPSPRGSCPPGSRCVSGGCVLCDDAGFCGQECISCDGVTPACGGAEAGCIIDPADDCVGRPDFTRCQVLTTPDRSYDICVSGSCVSPGCGDATCNAPGPDFDLADTNQRLCYDPADIITCPGIAGDATCGSTPYCGQDAQYGWDAENPPSTRFARTETTAEEPVVTDAVTGLVWQGCVAELRGVDCTLGISGTMDWSSAVAYCDALIWAGYADWRMPSAFELQSITDYGRWDPAIDPDAFPATLPESFWSSSTYAVDTTRAWRVLLDEGQVSTVAKITTFHSRVRCVRRASPSVENLVRFVVSVPVANQPVVFDEHTRIEWQGCSRGQSGVSCSGTYIPSNWPTAVSYCENLNWGGYTDWRMPNVKELNSLINDRDPVHAIDGVVFPGVRSTLYWSSSQVAQYPGTMWSVDFSHGGMTKIAMLSPNWFVFCARQGG